VLRSVKLTIDRTGEEGVPEREKVFFWEFGTGSTGNGR
jgi:hypothetical protein